MLLGMRVRVRRRAVLLVAGTALAAAALAPRPARADFGQDEKKFDNLAYPREFRARVTEAIDRGSKWLLSRQQPDGSWPTSYTAAYPMGPSALATLALLKSGLPRDHPRMERAFAYLRSRPLRKTYEVSILLMALDAKYEVPQDPFAVEAVDRYGNRVVDDPCEANISKEDLAWMKDAVQFLVDNQTSGTWRYPEGGFDLSNTQYALLGLKAAVRCGVKVPQKVWQDALAFLLTYQDADGPEVSLRANEVRGAYRIEWSEKAKARGFRYATAKNPLTGAMTTAGAAGLAICQSELWKSRKFGAEQRARTREALRDAMAWMQKSFAVTENPGLGATHHYYYLYGLERMGIVGHVRFLGPTDWYLEGAEFLLGEQAEDGCWQSGDVVESCFALLFLKRGSVRVENPAITRSEPGGPPPAPPSPSMGDGR
jgi:hypothetical protein